MWPSRGREQASSFATPPPAGRSDGSGPNGTPVQADTAARTQQLAAFIRSANRSAPDVDHLLLLVAQQVCDLIGDACAIHLVSEDGQWLDRVALKARDAVGAGQAVASLGPPRQPFEAGSDGHMVATGQTLRLPDRRMDRAPTEPRKIAAPLLVRGRVIGTATVVRLPSGSAFTRADQLFLNELADRAALAIDNAQLYAAGVEAEVSLRRSKESLRLIAETAKARAVQQAAVAELGRRALAETDLASLMATAAHVVADCLGDEYSKITELLPDGQGLVLRAGVGWTAGLVGTVRLAAGRGSLSGYTLLVGAPVIVEDLARERRFTPPPLLVDHGVVSGASVIISLDGEPYGVLSTHSSRPRRFTADEVNFLQSVANVVATAMVRLRNEELRERGRHQERLASVGRLAAGVAHDFNNVISVINMYAEMLESQEGLDALGREQLAHIRQQAEQGAAMTWQILDFAHRDPMEGVEVDLDIFLDDLLPVLRGMLPGEIDVRLRRGRGPHRVTGDVGRLEQIMMNLTTNARDAMASGGRLEISLEREELAAPSRARAAGLPSGTWVRVDVSDTGAGIAPEALPRVFEPFFSTKAVGHGTGLGLAQVHGFVSQHGGHVEIASLPGQGTTVTVRLPAADRAEPPPATATRR